MSRDLVRARVEGPRPLRSVGNLFSFWGLLGGFRVSGVGIITNGVLATPLDFHLRFMLGVSGFLGGGGGDNDKRCACYGACSFHNLGYLEKHILQQDFCLASTVRLCLK